MTRLLRFAWLVLVFNVVVILGGALVRATGSGAGCGRSWPTCQGQIVPEMGGATTIEFSHRAMSGLALLLVVLLALWVRGATDRGHPARTGALLSVIAIVGEALIGAMIVLAEWVGDDASVARVVAVPLHLVNTLFLLAALTLTVFWISGGGRLDWRASRRVTKGVAVAGIALVLIFASGAVTALADTLFPIGGDDLSDEEHFLTTIRVVHPALAVVVVAAAWWASARSRMPRGRAAKAIPILVGAMMLTGVANIFLGVPVAMQLLHLALADALWVAYVLLSARLLSVTPIREAV